MSITEDGLTPTPPATLRQEVVDLVSATNPGYTANLPASMIEDMVSTEVGSLTLIDQAKVDTVDSLTPRGSNAWLLTQLGQLYGVPLFDAVNTSVFVVFTGTPGQVVPKGFIVSDGTYQYVVQDGGVIASGGQSVQLFCVSTTGGSFAVLPGTVTQFVTSVPTINGQQTLTGCSNPQAGTPAGTPLTEEAYRALTIQAGNAPATGMASLLKTLLARVAGVQARLVSVVQAFNPAGWSVIVGGGDPYEVAYAIYRADFWIPGLVPSQINVSDISRAFNGVVTTVENHGLTDGQSGVMINGATGMTQINGSPITAAVIDEKQFSTGINTSAYGLYTGGGVMTPNPRNIVVSIADTPNFYQIPYINPPVQDVEILLQWGSTAVNIASDATVAALGQQPLVDYVNTVVAGQPMNLFELERTFQEAVVSIIPASQLTRMVFGVSINGVSAPPETGTGIIAGDPESYFLTDTSKITIVRG